MTAHDQISTPCGLAAFASEWFDISVPTWFANSMARDASKHRERWETAAGPYIWLKNRLLEDGLFHGVGRNSPDDSHPTATLHVGFLSIIESPEMIERLRNESMESGKPARSRFANDARTKNVAPVDATAGRMYRGNAK